MGHPRFVKYLSLKDPRKVLAVARRKFEVVSHTAYAFLKLLKRFEIFVVSDLDENTKEKLESVGINFVDPDELDKEVSDFRGMKYFIPSGNITFPYLPVEGG